MSDELAAESLGGRVLWVVFFLLVLIPVTSVLAGGLVVIGDTVVSPSGIEMIRVLPGTFLMGSPPDEPERSAIEQQHQVTISREYWLGRMEVTQRLWQAVMGNNPAKIKGPENPVEQVSWYDCVQFCNALSLREELTPAYEISGNNIVWDKTANGYRLPTEAEWEFACRAGSTGPRTGDLDEVAIYALNSGRETRVVGGRKANPWGFHDMYGNVWEWCWDRLEMDYGTASVTDPTGGSDGEHRIERGGSWHRNPRDLRSASRGADAATARRNALGLRVARWVQ